MQDGLGQTIRGFAATLRGYPKFASNTLCGENLGIFEHRTKVGILDVTLFATCSAGGRFLAKGVVV